MRVLKMTEQSGLRFDVTALSTDGSFLTAESLPRCLNSSFYGDSITCGYGNMKAGSGGK